MKLPEPDPGFWRRWLKRWRKTHPLPKPRPKPKPPSPPPAATASWSIPGPIILTASDPDAALDPATGKPRAGVAAIGVIVVPGVCPLWRVTTTSGTPRTGWVAQIEGADQIDIAYSLLKDKPVSDSRAIIGTGNVPATRMAELGVNSAFYELNAQAGWEPYGNAARILFQGHQDGYEYVMPSYGVYDGVGLKDYADYVPMIWDSQTNGFIRGSEPQGLPTSALCIFLAEGMSNTNSWPYLASKFG